MRSSAARTDAVNARMSPPADLEREFGQDRGEDRLGEDGVRREEEHERHLVRDDTAGDGTADDDRGAEEQSGVRVEQRAPTREPQQPPEPGVAAEPARPQGEAALAGREAEDPDEGDDAAGPGDREQQPFGVGEPQRRIGTGHDPEDDQAPRPSPRCCRSVPRR